MPAKFPILLRAVLLVGVACSLNGQFLVRAQTGHAQTSRAQVSRAQTDAKSIRANFKAGPGQNQQLITQTNYAGQRSRCDLTSKTARLSDDGRASRDRQPDLFRQTRTQPPTGHFSIMEKDADHRSNIYGDFVDSSGRVVRAGISAKIDSAPSGTHYVGAPMRWFMRLTGEGVGMHVGILPGYPASHGCIRMPPDGAKLFYDNVKIGTPVDVGEF